MPSRFSLPLATLLLCLVLPCPAQEKQRDLRIEKSPSTESPQSAVVIPRSYALVVGISQYQNLPPANQLRFTERDAERIYSILISPAGGNFKAENVHKMIGPKATLQSLRRELEEWLPTVAKDEDRVLIYFAGHGFVFNGKAYLAPYDIDQKRIAATGYPMDSLGRVIGSRIKAKYKVLLTDSCHSGAITPYTDSQMVNRSLLDLDRSLFSLTASRDRESSFESPDWGGGHGIFTYYVAKGMEGEADQNGDGIVTADELAEYVRRNVREATQTKQNPTAERGSFDPNLPLSYLPEILKRRARIMPASDFGTLVIEANLDGVEVFVDGKSEGVVNKGVPLKLQGYRPGAHTIKGVKMGYEPDGPREEMVYPGQETTVSIRILIPRRRSKAVLQLLDKGLEYYNKGYAQNYRKAAEQFQKALAQDPSYSQAALYLGRTYHALDEHESAAKYFRRAIDIDPDYVEARASFAGMLLDINDVDEAIRQLNAVVQRDPNHALAHYLLAQAFRMKDLYTNSIESARKAISLKPNNAEAHFWLAESLRMRGDEISRDASPKGARIESEGSRTPASDAVVYFKQAETEYLEYLRLSDFDSKLLGKLDFYVKGFLIGKGKKTRASQQDLWKDLRSLAYFGLGDCERLLRQPDPAIDYYQKSASYDPTDPLIYWGLGLAFSVKAEMTQTTEGLSEARAYFLKMLALNPDLTQAEKAKKYIARIDEALQERR
jgi:tetratricopeptide (TPR) repeat protein